METEFSKKYLPLIIFSALVLSVLWFFGPVLTNLFSQLATDEDYSYGLLLPLVSGYLVYLKWPQIQRQPWQPSWGGLAIIFLGLSIYLIGELMADLYLPRLAFIVVLSGTVYLVGGYPAVRLLFFPLLLLALMLPLPGGITKRVTLPLQLISSWLATDVLRLIGIPAVRQGNVIDLGVRQLQVVAACSGLRYLLSLLALAIIFCYFYQRNFWKAAILILSLIPTAIIANALRVAGMGIFPVLQEGFWHGFSGWLIFLFCFAILGLINWFLNRLFPPSTVETYDESSQGPSLSSRVAIATYTPYLVAALTLVLLTGPFFRSAAEAPPVALLNSLTNFPLELGPWQGKHVYIDPEMVKATQSSDHINAEYTNYNNDYITLWIAYYESQKKAGGFVHNPWGCLLGGGWNTLANGTYEISPSLPVNYVLMDQGTAQVLVFYWYLQRGRWVVNDLINKFYLGYDGLLNRRTDGALIRLITPVSGNDLKTAQERLANFARLLVPVLPQYIPN